MRETRVAVLGLIVISCAAEGPSLEEGRASRIEISNGAVLNGTFANGRRFQGVMLAGPQTQGRHGDGAVFGSLQLDGSRLVDEGGWPLEAGARLPAVADDGLPLDLEIYAVEERGGAVLYDVLTPIDGRLANICGQEGVGAVPMEGVWDYASGRWFPWDGAITFACATGVIGKCIELGYAPWKPTITVSTGQVQMTALLQICTRALRADILGDGRPHTRDGNLVDISDFFWIQEHVGHLDELEWSGSWPAEAVWHAGGAACVDHLRPGGGGPEELARIRAAGIPACAEAPGPVLGYGWLIATRSLPSD